MSIVWTNRRFGCITLYQYKIFYTDDRKRTLGHVPSYIQTLHFLTSHKLTPLLSGHFFWSRGCPRTGGLTAHPKRLFVQTIDTLHFFQWIYFYLYTSVTYLKEFFVHFLTFVSHFFSPTRNGARTIVSQNTPFSRYEFAFNSLLSNFFK